MTFFFFLNMLFFYWRRYNFPKHIEQGCVQGPDYYFFFKEEKYYYIIICEIEVSCLVEHDQLDTLYSGGDDNYDNKIKSNIKEDFSIEKEK